MELMHMELLLETKYSTAHERFHLPSIFDPLSTLQGSQLSSFLEEETEGLPWWSNG